MLETCMISGFADEIHKDLDTQTEVLKSLGQRFIELRSADGINIADMTTEKAQEVKARLDAAGIAVSALGTPIGKIGITDAFEPHFQQFRHVVELAKLFETRYLRIFSFYIPKGERPKDYREEVMRRIGLLTEYATEQDVVLLHENEKGIYGDRAARCLELMEQFYGGHFQCTFDFANFIQCGQDTLEAYEMLKPYISYIHVKDALAENGEVTPAGEGDGHVEEILSRLDRSGYCGFLSLEPHLADFCGFEKLESGEVVRKKLNGEEAYRLAHRSLTKILKKQK